MRQAKKSELHSKRSVIMKSILGVLSRIKSDLLKGENLDSYVAIALGFVLAGWGIFGKIQQDWLNNLSILTLTLLLIGTLKNRYLLQDAGKSLQDIWKPDASHALKDRAEYDPLEDRLSGAKEVFVVGRHLLGFLGYNKDVIRKFAKTGCYFRFVLLDPGIIQDGTSKADIRRALSIIQQLSRDCPGRFRVRLAQSILPLAVFAVGIDTPDGLIQVQPHPLFQETDHRPHFDLLASSSQTRWYDHYREQIGLLWENSVEGALDMVQDAQLG
jgi:hypothetical protein